MNQQNRREVFGNSELSDELVELDARELMTVAGGTESKPMTQQVYTEGGAAVTFVDKTTDFDSAGRAVSKGGDAVGELGGFVAS